MAPSEERLHPEPGSGGGGHRVKHPWPDGRGHGGPTTPDPSAPHAGIHGAAHRILRGGEEGRGRRRR